MLNVDLRLRLLAIGCGIVAVWLAGQLAQGNYTLPTLIAFVALCGILVRALHAQLSAIALGVVLFGYIVGNRGFAQLMPVPSFPLLPAEIVLIITGGWVVLQCAYSHRLPFRKDALNWMYRRVQHIESIAPSHIYWLVEHIILMFRFKVHGH